MAFIVSNFINLTDDEQIDFKDWIKDVLFKKLKGVDKSLINEAILTFEKGEAEQMTYAIERLFDEEHAKAVEIGIEQGIERGFKQARAEMAKEMLLENIPLDKIAKVSKLTLDTIKKLQKDLM